MLLRDQTLAKEDNYKREIARLQDQYVEGRFELVAAL